MEQYLIDQYLARIGYASDSEQHILEPNLNPRPDIRPVTIEEVQAKILHQLKAQYEAQQAAATVSSRPAAQTRTPDIGNGIAPSILPDTPSTTCTPGPEASYHTFESRHEPEFPSPPPPPPRLTKAELLTGLHSELEHRQKICHGIEHQIEICQKEIRTLPIKQKKIEKEHEQRVAQLMKPVHNENQKTDDLEERESVKTAEEAEVEEMRSIYLQYDRDLRGVPTAESVDALFAVIAETENRLQKAEESNKAAKRREVKLEGKVYRARCAMFEMEDEIVGVENGGIRAMPEDNKESMVEISRIGAQKGSRRKPRRGKGVKDGQQGRRDGGEEKVGRRRKRRRNLSGKAGKMSSDTAR